MRELSVIIVGNNEMFHSRTIEDVLKNKRADTEIIAVLDGGVWANPPIPPHLDVSVIYSPTTLGQRGATQLGIQLSKAKFIMKLDAHCSWDEGYDQKMLDAFKETGDNVTMVGVMRNLHAFDWKCYGCGKRTYQGPTPQSCSQCGSTKIRRKMTWEPRKGTYSTSYSFDSEPHFQYNNEYKNTPQYVKDKTETGLTETMSLQGSCWMATRDKYWELKLTDPDFGSWGNEGLEVACKTWLSGGRVLVNHKTWYSHMFRTQGQDFSFPYPQSGRAVQKTKQAIAKMFFENKYPKQILPLSWLLDKFAPTPGWNDEQLAKMREAGAAFINERAEKLRLLSIVPPIPGTVANETTPMTSDSNG